MENAGSALMGIGYGSGENRAIEAARGAIESPLLELSINGARGLLLNITGGNDLSMFEVDEASRLITESTDPNANIIFGTSIDEAFTGEIKITVIATGFSEESNMHIGSMSRGGFGQSRIFGNSNSAPIPAKSSSPSNNSRPSGYGNAAPSLNKPSTPEPQNDYEIPAFLRNKMPK